VGARGQQHEEGRRLRLRAAVLDLAPPALVLIAAAALVRHAGALPPQSAEYLNYLLLALAASMSIAFRSSRVFYAALTLGAACLAFRSFLQQGQDEFTAYAVFGALCLFVPINLGALNFTRERGIFNRHGLRCAAVLGVQIALTAGVVLSRSEAAVAWIYHPLGEPAWLPASPVPPLGFAALTLAVAAGAAAWFATGSATQLGLMAACIAFGLAAHGITRPAMFEVFLGAAELILVIAVLQHARRMVYRDELTRLPGRRALNERLAGLSGDYTVAMLDVDHFKSLNDSYGHDFGDQVLKMVATKLVQVGGGGIAYRYGGEEFTVLFPGKSTEEVLPHLEDLRERIAAHALRLRAKDRPEKPSATKRRTAAGSSVSVTVSIGVAQHSDRLIAPEDVLRAADQALYRAKSKGRNNVSR
jgi:diguanylate cyclase (GGDEF)-like protein